MNEDEISRVLSNCTLEQLEQITEKLQSLAAQKQAQKRTPRFPPSGTNDLQSLAEMQGLDLSRLLREISKR